MFNFIPQLLKNLFTKPATRWHPYKKQAPFTQVGGKIQIEISKCIFCGTCMRSCPALAVEVKEESRKWIWHPFRCIVCLTCVENCSTQALYCSTEDRLSSYAKEEEVYIGKVETKD